MFRGASVVPRCTCGFGGSVHVWAHLRKDGEKGGTKRCKSSKSSLVRLYTGLGVDQSGVTTNWSQCKETLCYDRGGGEVGSFRVATEPQ